MELRQSPCQVQAHFVIRFGGWLSCRTVPFVRVCNGAIHKLLAPVLQEFTIGDAVQPGAPLRIVAKIRQGAPGLQEGFLCKLVSQCGVPVGELAQYGAHPTLVPSH